MSYDNFLSYLQQLLTMLDANNQYSVTMAKSALELTVSLAELSNKIDRRTHVIMREAISCFDHLVRTAEDYAGKPGEYEENEMKRRRLELVLRPGC